MNISYFTLYGRCIAVYTVYDSRKRKLKIFHKVLLGSLVPECFALGNFWMKISKDDSRVVRFFCCPMRLLERQEYVNIFVLSTLNAAVILELLCFGVALV